MDGLCCNANFIHSVSPQARSLKCRCRIKKSTTALYKSYGTDAPAVQLILIDDIITVNRRSTMKTEN